jgi:hypothetical protein
MQGLPCRISGTCNAENLLDLEKLFGFLFWAGALMLLSAYGKAYAPDSSATTELDHPDKSSSSDAPKS